VKLDERGREQVVRLGERLAGLPLRGIVSSPMVRCRETAAAIATRQQPEAGVERESALAEVDYGEWTGGTLKTLSKEPLWRTVQAHPSAVTFPGGESMSGMAARSVSAVRRWDARIAAEHGDDAPWVAVSHGDVIKAILADALGIHLDQFQRIVVDPASVSVIRYTPDRPFVLMSNTHDGDLSFLAPAPPTKRKRRTTGAGDAAVGGGAGPDRG
jgi:probable phosphomutase (TIGR03848 family)